MRENIVSHDNYELCLRLTLSHHTVIFSVRDLIPRPVGVHSMGDNSFMSSILQCLINCAPLEKLFLLDLVHPYQSCDALHSGNRKRCVACELDKVFLAYFGSVNGIDAVAAVEEYHLASSSLSSSRFVHNTNKIYTNVRENTHCGHPIIPSSLMAEISKQVEMKQLAVKNTQDTPGFFQAFIHSLAACDLSYRKMSDKLKQIPSQTQIKLITTNEDDESTSECVT